MEPKLNDDVLQVWKNYVIERNRVYKKKEIDKLPAPWTEDKIIQTYRFTNDFRWQDRETKWLLENISNNPNLTYREKVLNSILFRTWNKSKTFEIVCGKGISENDLMNTPIEVFRNRIIEYSSEDIRYVWFTNAFHCGGIKGSWKYPEYNIEKFAYGNNDAEEVYEECIPVRMISLARYVSCSGILDSILESKTPEEMFEHLNSIYGIAEFLAYQMYMDITYIPGSKFSEDDFVSAGPGCRAGLDFLFETKNGNSYEQLLYWIWERQEDIFKEYNLEEEFNYPLYYRGKHLLSLHCIENSFCEFYKYWKVYSEIGKPRNKFKSQSTVQCKLF